MTTLDPEIGEAAEALEFGSIERLSARAIKLGGAISRDEARFLVDVYYTAQGERIAAAGRLRTLDQSSDVNSSVQHPVLSAFLSQYETMEANAGKALAAFASADPVGEWAMSITGIGPVISAGLLAHIDMYHGGPIDLETGERGRIEYVGHIWSFAGLDPNKTWDKGQKRPWNADLKTLCAFKIGESFVKQHNRPSDVYGKVYVARKEFEARRNESGYNQRAAEALLQTKNWSEGTDAIGWLRQGMLPPAQLHARARRYAVKLFLSHWHWVAYETYFNARPPKPYILDGDRGHNDFFAPPNWTERFPV